MPIIGHVESRSLRGRLIKLGIVVALSVGSFTILYPFAVMIAGSFRSEMDQADFDLVPDFWVDQGTLYGKFLETKYSQRVSDLNRDHQRNYYSFRDVVVPETGDAGRLAAWIKSPDGPPRHWQIMGGTFSYKVVPEKLRELRRRLKRKYNHDLESLTRDLGTAMHGWYEIRFNQPPQWLSSRYEMPDDPVFRMYNEMFDRSPAADRIILSLSGHFLESMVYTTYGQTSTDGYNRAHEKPLDSFHDFRLPRRVPGEDEPTLRAEWIEYVNEELNKSFVALEGVTQADYDTFQRDSLGLPEPLYELPDGRRWLSGLERGAYAQFVAAQRIERYRLEGPEFAYGQDELLADLPALEMQHVRENAGTLRWLYSIRSYNMVLDELFFQGRALINTVIFCSLSIILALLINPLAAYAMSRFKLPATYKILLFLMATMAFPYMVTLIPQFIMLRKMGLLNSFAALLLPIVTNGYLIFLLKGFFDSLPEQLYEAARIDGASEPRMFMQITMALSKPILAVLALQTFTAAYMMFLHALLTCPDQDMWIISVWLYQFQNRATPSAVFASIIIASVPTLLIFLVTQRTIMRGIVVPVEK